MDALPMSASNDSMYYPLNKSRSEIRLLEISRHIDDNEQIGCKLTTCSLSDNPEYIALSYVWGSRDKPVDILVNEHIVQVTENLAHALQDIRTNIVARNSKEEVFYFWIDALCINQDNKQERSDQVQMMKSIFAGAEWVLSWLGPSSPDIMLALETCRRLVKSLRLIYEEAPHISPQAQINKLASENHDLFEMNYTGVMKNTARNALWSLTQNEYWLRIWILQEISVSRIVWLMNGNVWIDFEDVLLVSLWC